MFLLWLLAALIAAVILIGLLPPVYKLQKTVGGYRKCTSLYVPMRDGVRIAIDVWLPSSLKKGEKIPAVLRSTRYVRTIEPGFWGKVLLLLGQKNALMGEMAPWEKSGYAGVLMDVRGTGASFGRQRVSWAPDEVADIREVVDWIVRQPWSDGQVGAYGISYHGNTAELTAALDHPAVKAVVPMFSDFEPYQLACPGGVLNEKFIQLWQKMNRALDDGDLAAANGIGGTKAFLLKFVYRGIQPADGWKGRKLLREAIAGHAANADVYMECKDVRFKDDAMPCGLSLMETSPYAYKEEIERGGVPMMIAVGMMDADTVDGAIARYNSFSNPQELYIGPWVHSGKRYADTLLSGTPQGVGLFRPYLVEKMIRFYDYYFGRGGVKPPERIVHCYTMGEGTMRDYTEFPPKGLTEYGLYFQKEHGLTQEPAKDESCVEYEVDFTASTGKRNRWFTQLGGSPIDPGDRQAQDEKLLVFTTEPLPRDLRVIGQACIDLFVECSVADNAYFAYLEAVDENGYSHYITEGVTRPEVDGATNLQKDARNVAAGSGYEIEIRLFSVSALVKKGWRLRAALGGHDASGFERCPAEGNVKWRVNCGGNRASGIKLPVSAADGE